MDKRNNMKNKIEHEELVNKLGIRVKLIGLLLLGVIIWGVLGLSGCSSDVIEIDLSANTEISSLNTDKKSYNRLDKLDYRGSTVNISTVTDKLTYYPSTVSVQFRENTYVVCDFGLDDVRMTGCDIYKNMAYLKYTNEDGSLLTEIILIDDLVDGLELPQGMAEYISKKSNSNKVITITTDKINQQVSALNWYNLGYVIVRQYQEGSLSSGFFSNKMAHTIGTTLLPCKERVGSIKERFYIGIDGLGEYDVNTLSFLNNHGGVYFGTDEILRLYNYETDEACGFITHLNNEYLSNDASRLVGADGNDSLYFDSEIDNIDHMGYNGFAVKTSKGTYYIKLAEKYSTKEREEVLNMLHINQENIE